MGNKNYQWMKTLFFAVMLLALPCISSAERHKEHNGHGMQEKNWNIQSNRHGHRHNGHNGYHGNNVNSGRYYHNGRHYHYYNNGSYYNYYHSGTYYNYYNNGGYFLYYLNGVYCNQPRNGRCY